MITDVKELQPKNAEPPIELTEFEIIIEVK